MILVDPRVGSKHMAPLFAELKAPHEICPLLFGDCMFLGNGPDGNVVKVGIEIKGGRGGSDFVSSMQSGRLVGHQAQGLALNYERCYLIIEGLRPNKNGVVWTVPHRGRMRPVFMWDIERFIVGLEESGLRVRRTTDPQHTARVIVNELYHFWQKPYDEHSSVGTVYAEPMFSLAPENEALARFRRILVAAKVGIGVGRSKAVAEHFGAIYDMVVSTIDDWRGIEGVGAKTAGEAIRAFREVIRETKSTAERSPARRTSAPRVSPGNRRADRSARTPRQRQGSRMDSGAGTERGVRKAPARGGIAPRREPQRGRTGRPHRHRKVES